MSVLETCNSLNETPEMATPYPFQAQVGSSGTGYQAQHTIHGLNDGGGGLDREKNGTSAEGAKNTFRINLIDLDTDF